MAKKILIHQILSKFPLDVNLKLEDTKVFGRAWTMELLRQLLSQYVEKQENAQRHFANKGYGSEFKPVRYGENRQNYQNLIDIQVTKTEIPTHPQLQWKPLQLMFREKVDLCLIV